MVDFKSAFTDLSKGPTLRAASGVIVGAWDAGSFAQRTQALRQAFEAAAAEAQPAEGQTA